MIENKQINKCSCDNNKFKIREDFCCNSDSSYKYGVIVTISCSRCKNTVVTKGPSLEQAINAWNSAMREIK